MVKLAELHWKVCTILIKRKESSGHLSLPGFRRADFRDGVKQAGDCVAAVAAEFGH
jgi:hypothetical protein